MNTEALEVRALLDKIYGADNVLTFRQLAKQYEIIGSEFPVIAVRRKSDGVVGSFLYSPSRLFYFGWENMKRLRGRSRRLSVSKEYGKNNIDIDMYSKGSHSAFSRHRENHPSVTFHWLLSYVLVGIPRKVVGKQPIHDASSFPSQPML